MEALTRISVLGIELYRRYFQLLESYARENNTLTELIKRIQGVTDQIKRIGASENNPELILEIGKEMQRQHTEMVEQQHRSILENEELKIATHQRMNQVSQHIEQWIQEGETIDLYWEDGVNEKGVRLESRTVTDSSRKRNWYGRVKKRSHSHAVTDSIPLVIPRDFSYQGPPLERVDKVPESSPCWSKETLSEDKKSFSIHYESILGQDAVANIKVHVKRKNRLDQIEIRRGLETDLKRETQEIERLEETIRMHRMLKNIAQRTVDFKAQDLERVEEYNITLKTLKEQMVKLEQALSGITQDIHLTQESIAQHLPEFKFVNDYLDLSQDGQMAKHESIVKFIALNERFRTSIPLQP